MDGLAEVVELPVRLGLRALDRLPRGIRNVGEQGASLTDVLSVGAVFELDSYNLLLRGTVEKLDYAELEPAYGVFAELQLLLQVFRKG